MKEIAQLIFSTLTGDSRFTSVMGQRFFPLFGKEDTEYPFSVYNIGETAYQSKDFRMFPVLISLCYQPENYTEAIEFSDVVKEIVEGMPNTVFLDTTQSFDQDNQTIIININIQIIK